MEKGQLNITVLFNKKRQCSFAVYMSSIFEKRDNENELARVV